MNYLDLENKNIVITGANRGIGKGLCEAFLKNNCTVVALYRKEQPAFVLSKKEKEKVIYLKGDITEIQPIASWLNDFESQGKQVDVLINIAAVNLSKPLIDCEENDFDCIINTNLKAVFFLSQLFARHMKKQSSGVIINAISFGAKIPSANVGFYSTSKSALKTLTKCMAAEWAPYGIRVNGFSPGVIPTEMTESTIKEKKVELIRAISMQRLGKIQEVANAVLFLASQSSSYITGIDLEISGGKFLLQDPQTPWQESKR